MFSSILSESKVGRKNVVAMARRLRQCRLTNRVSPRTISMNLWFMLDREVVALERTARGW